MSYDSSSAGDAGDDAPGEYLVRLLVTARVYARQASSAEREARAWLDRVVADSAGADSQGGAVAPSGVEVERAGAGVGAGAGAGTGRAPVVATGPGDPFDTAAAVACKAAGASTRHARDLGRQVEVCREYGAALDPGDPARARHERLIPLLERLAGLHGQAAACSDDLIDLLDAEDGPS